MSEKTFYKDFAIVFFIAIASIMVVVSMSLNIINGEKVKNLSQQIEHLTEVLDSVYVIERISE